MVFIIIIYLLTWLFQPYNYNQDVPLPSLPVKAQELASLNSGDVMKMRIVTTKVMRVAAVSIISLYYNYTSIKFQFILELIRLTLA